MSKIKSLFKGLDKLRNRFALKAEVPKILDAIGKTVNIDGNPVTIEHITGNMQKVYCAEINGKYLISWLDLFAQLNDEIVTPEDIQAFNEIQLEIESTHKTKGKNPNVRPAKH